MNEIPNWRRLPEVQSIEKRLPELRAALSVAAPKVDRAETELANAEERKKTTQVMATIGRGSQKDVTADTAAINVAMRAVAEARVDRDDVANQLEQLERLAPEIIETAKDRVRAEILRLYRSALGDLGTAIAAAQAKQRVVHELREALIEQFSDPTGASAAVSGVDTGLLALGATWQRRLGRDELIHTSCPVARWRREAKNYGVSV